jgi:hypothetical protein
MSASTTVNNLIKEFSDGGLLKTGEVSDGYHTFDELYNHRNVLFVQLCKTWYTLYPTANIWRSIKNSDGSMWKGWFIMGLGKEEGKQITYHLPIEFWEQTHFAETLDIGLWDGHTSKEVLERLTNKLIKKNDPRDI